MNSHCARLRERLSAYVDQETTAAENSELAEHLKVCPACRAEWAALQHLAEALNRLALPPPAGLAQQVRRRLHPRRYAWGRAMTLAASLILGMVAGGGLTKELYYFPANGNGTELASLEEVLQNFPPGSLEGLSPSYQEDEDRSA